MDISGSMSENSKEMLEHIYEICSTVNGSVSVRMCDIMTRYYKKNITKHDIDSFDWKSVTGWGGTELSDSIKESVKNRPDVLVIITDMMLFGEDLDTLNNLSNKIRLIICTDCSHERLTSIITKRKFKYVDLKSVA
jgi:hypothetical protein